MLCQNFYKECCGCASRWTTGKYWVDTIIKLVKPRKNFCRKNQQQQILCQKNSRRNVAAQRQVYNWELLGGQAMMGPGMGKSKTMYQHKWHGAKKTYTIGASNNLIANHLAQLFLVVFCRPQLYSNQKFHNVCSILLILCLTRQCSWKISTGWNNKIAQIYI